MTNSNEPPRRPARRQPTRRSTAPRTSVSSARDELERERELYSQHDPTASFMHERVQNKPAGQERGASSAFPRVCRCWQRSYCPFACCREPARPNKPGTHCQWQHVQRVGLGSARVRKRKSAYAAGRRAAPLPQAQANVYRASRDSALPRAQVSACPALKASAPTRKAVSACRALQCRKMLTNT